MAISGRGPPYKPGASIRGRVLFSTQRGVPVAKPWPKPKPMKPGSKREWWARTFGAANRACKVTAAAFYDQHWKDTRGTPLLPRDLMVVFMYGRAFGLIMPDGKEVYSMQARSDVSKSLDILGSQPGSLLIRGEKFWEVAGAAPSTTKRATIYRATPINNANFTTIQPLPFDTVLEDVGPWASISTHPTRLTVPADVPLVQITAAVHWTAAAASSVAVAIIGKNGLITEIGTPRSIQNTNHTNATFSLVTAPLPVTEGDFFEVIVQSIGDSAVNVQPNQTWLSATEIK